MSINIKVVISNRLGEQKKLAISKKDVISAIVIDALREEFDLLPIDVSPERIVKII
jgi:hypothetical protein